MSLQKTSISWTDYTWNTITGCLAVSPGCDNCYAAEIAARFDGSVAFPAGTAKRAPSGRAYFTGKIILRPHALDDPLALNRRLEREGRTAKVFTCSMADLFHPEVPDTFIDAVFDRMEACPRITFQILTKRPERMRDYMHKRYIDLQWGYRPIVGHYHTPPNIWCGTSVEDQKRADERVPILLSTPAAIRFLSVEPMLGAVSLEQWLWRTTYMDPDFTVVNGREAVDLIHWVIVGGESGKQRRPMDKDWVLDLRDQCQAASIAFWFKQDSDRRSEQRPYLEGWKYAQFPDRPLIEQPPTAWGSCEGEPLDARQAVLV